MSEFRRRTISGMKWSIVSQGVRQVLGLITTVWLARLLSPRDFGLVGMVTVIANFAALFGELGFSAALVQKKDVTQEHLSSVFWLNLGCGLVLTALFAAAAPLVASFNREPILVPLTVFIAADFLVSSLNIVQNTLLTRALSFRTLSVVEISAIAASGGLAIVMALAGFGVWSLAAQMVSLSAVTAAMLWKLAHWRPDLRFSWPAIRDLLGYSLNYFGSRALIYWTRNADYLLIGRFLGANPLGVYTRAYVVMMVPLLNVSRVLGRVMFPSLALIQDDKARVKRTYLKVTRVIALITFPMMLGLFVCVEPFVLVVFGRSWREMIPLLRVFALTGMLESVSTLNSNIFQSQGRTDQQFRLDLVLRTVLVAGIAIGLRWGILGVAIGYSVASALNTYPSVYFAGRLVGLSFAELAANLASILGCSLAMAGIAWAAGRFVFAGWPHWATLAGQVLCGAAAYALLVHFFQVPAYLEARQVVLDQLRSMLAPRRRASPADTAS